MNTLTAQVILATDRVCPISPGKAADHATHQITGNLLWGIIIGFGVAILLGVGALVAGRALGMPHLSKGGVITLIVVFIAGVLMLTVPGMFHGVIGNGCVNLG